MSTTPRPDRDVAAEVAAPQPRPAHVPSLRRAGRRRPGRGRPARSLLIVDHPRRPHRGASASAPKKGGNLRVGLTGGGSSDTLNPFFGGISAIGTARAQQLYQPLIQLANNAQLQYVLAEEIVPNGSTSNWHIKLRSGVTFHNGKPFGADDVIYTLQTILNPKKPLGGALVLSPVDVKGLKKVDNLTVEVPMKAPFGSFPEQLAAFWYFLYIAPNGWTQKDTPNGTGPFKYKSFTPGQQSVFVRNTNYWKAGLPHLDSVTIIDFQDPTAVQNALVSKAIDCYRAAHRDPDEDPAEHERDHRRPVADRGYRAVHHAHGRGAVQGRQRPPGVPVHRQPPRVHRQDPGRLRLGGARRHVALRPGLRQLAEPGAGHRAGPQPAEEGRLTTTT